MRVVYPITQLNKRFPVAKFIMQLTNNFHYRKVKLILEKLLCVLTCKGDDPIGLELDLGTEESVLRLPDPMALKTVISNSGEDYAQIFEEHHLIQIVPPGTSRTLPLNAKLLITGRAESSETVIFITTYRRCLCGDDPPLPYAGSEPVGGSLI